MPIELTQDVPTPQPARWGCAATAGILGWVLDAFDFFVLVFLVDVLAAHFHVGKRAIVVSLTVTLAMRPLGGFCWGCGPTGVDAALHWWPACCTSA